MEREWAGADKLGMGVEDASAGGPQAPEISSKMAIATMPMISPAAVPTWGRPARRGRERGGLGGSGSGCEWE